MSQPVKLRPDDIVVESIEVHELDYLIAADEVANINEASCSCGATACYATECTCHWLACALTFECGATQPAEA